jgi:hypothetical protein
MACEHRRVVLSLRMTKTAPSPLVDIVTAFDEELKRFEHLVGEACRTKLVSEKALRRAAKAASEAADSEARMGELMARFGAVLNETRQRNEDAQRRLREKEAEIVAKDQQLKAFVVRLQAVAERARAISQAMQQAVSAPTNGHDDEPLQVDVDALASIDALIEPYLADSKALIDEARDAGLPDFADQVDELRKQIVSARKRMDRAVDMAGKLES